MMALVGHVFFDNDLPKKFEKMKDSLNFSANIKYLYVNAQFKGDNKVSKH